MEKPSITLWLRKRRALRGVPLLTADSGEGDRVRADGVAHSIESGDPFIAPVLDKPCAIGWMKYWTNPSPHGRKKREVIFERWHIRPFNLQTVNGDVIVDASHVQLLVPTFVEGGIEERAVADGHTIAVVGTMLRDGIELAGGEQSFRTARPLCKLVGNKAHPVLIVRMR